jgi:hypothetical protein
MGCFDSVNIHCPKCDELIEVQSKAGKCLLDMYSSGEVPLVIAADIEGREYTCQSCGCQFKLVLNVPKTVQILAARLD